METLLVYVKAFVQNRTLFLCDEDYGSFVGVLKQCAERFECRIHCFCLLPSSYHLLIEAAEEKLLHCIRYLHQQYGRHGATDAKTTRLCWNTEYTMTEKNFFAAELSLYIHGLPCLTGLADMPCSYQWSSLCMYISGSRAYDFVIVSDVLDQLCSGYFWAKKEYRKKFMRFCVTDIPLHLQNGLEAKCIGSRTFCQAVPRLKK